MDILSWWDKFKINMSFVYHRAVFWVLSAWGLIHVYWDTMMTDQDHLAFYDMMPFGLGKLAPFIIFGVSYLIANGWPQPALKEKLAAKTDAVETDKLMQLNLERKQ